MALSSLPDSWVIVDCVACGCVALVRPTPVPKGCRVRAYGGRIKDRPYCVECLTFPGGEPDDRSKSSDYRRSTGQREKFFALNVKPSL